MNGSDIVYKCVECGTEYGLVDAVRAQYACRCGGVLLVSEIVILDEEEGES